MAPPIKRQQRLSRIQYVQGKIRKFRSRIQNVQGKIRNFRNQYVNTNFMKRLIFDPSLIWVLAIILIIAEIY